MGFRFPAPLLGAGGRPRVPVPRRRTRSGAGPSPAPSPASSRTPTASGWPCSSWASPTAPTRAGEGPGCRRRVLALTALAHGYAVLWAGLSAVLLPVRRPPARAHARLARRGGRPRLRAGRVLAAARCSRAWGWTTPYDDPWITVAARNLLPPLLWPLFVAALLSAWLWTLLPRAARGRARPPAAVPAALPPLIGAALAAAGPALGIIDVRFVPFAQLALCLAGGRDDRPRAPAPGRAATWPRWPSCCSAIVHADAHSRVLRALGRLELHGAGGEGALAGVRARSRSGCGARSPTRAWPSSTTPRTRSAGSIRMYETLPLFSGPLDAGGRLQPGQPADARRLLPGLGARRDLAQPVPQARLLAASTPSPPSRHLRLFDVSRGGRAEPPARGRAWTRARRRAGSRACRPITSSDLDGAGRGYVEPLAFAPVRSSAARLARQVVPLVHAQAAVVRPISCSPTTRVRRWSRRTSGWPRPRSPLPGGVEAQATVEDESDHASPRTASGHPLLVKVSYHPRWKAEGADGPYLVSPALMMVVPRQPTVTLTYARTLADHLGLAPHGGGAGGGRGRRSPGAGAAAGSRGRAGNVPPIPLDDCADARAHAALGRGDPGRVPPRLLGAAARDAARPTRADPMPLYESASRAYGEGRFAEAAEYARHALASGATVPLRGGAALPARREPAARGPAPPGRAVVPGRARPARAQPLRRAGALRRDAGPRRGRRAWSSARAARDQLAARLRRLALGAARPAGVRARGRRSSGLEPPWPCARSRAAARAGPRRSRDGARPRDRPRSSTGMSWR